MSFDDELERLLREGRGALPEPDVGVTERARSRALAAGRRGLRRTRMAALGGPAFVVAVAIALGTISLGAPRVTAAEGDVGIGFLPEPGWSALQAPARSPSDQPAVTMAANSPFASEDVVNGLAEPSALPYSTLLSLPARGVVIVASFIAADDFPPSSIAYPVREEPLRLRDATPYIEFGTAIRPDQPLGQYQLRGAVKGWYIDLHVYFGTPRPTRRQLALAQRQLDGLVIRPAPSTGRARAVAPKRGASVARLVVVDRTFTCTPGYIGGAYTVAARVHTAAGRRGATWDQPVMAAIGTSAVGAAQTAVENYVAWISAGEPSRTASVTPTFGSWSFPFREWGTVSVNMKTCRSAKRANVALADKGLVRRAVDVFDDVYDCVTPRRVLVRVRATVRVGGSPAASGPLRPYRAFLRTTAPARVAEVAARTPSGKPIAYARVLESGKARLFTAKGCVQD